MKNSVLFAAFLIFPLSCPVANALPCFSDSTDEIVVVDEETSETTLTNKALRISAPNHERVVRVERVEPTYLKPGHIMFYYCLDCNKSFYDVGCKNEIPNSNGSFTSKTDGRYIAPLTKELNILGKNIRDYLSAETDEDVIKALKNNMPYNDQLDNKITWPTSSAPYTVEVSETNTFSSIKSFITNKNSFSFDRFLIPGQQFFYRIKDSTGEIIYDNLSCKVKDDFTLRTVYVDGVSNVRDVGGWQASNGKRVKYGMLFRGARLNSISDNGKETLLNPETGLGVKTEIDVRDDGTQAFVDARLSYNKCAMWQYTSILPDYECGVPQIRKNVYDGTGHPIDEDGNDVTTDPSKYITDFVPIGFSDYSPAGIKQVFELLANNNSYPSYIHCSAGADRTGTICYLILGLLGVSFEDITRDYELTSFSAQGARWRDNANDDETGFNGYGVHYVMTSPGKANVGYDIHQWGKLNQVLFTRYGTEDKLLSTAVENYLKAVCNVSQETIDNVRANMLESIPNN